VFLGGEAGQVSRCYWLAQFGCGQDLEAGFAENLRKAEAVDEGERRLDVITGQFHESDEVQQRVPQDCDAFILVAEPRCMPGAVSRAGEQRTDLAGTRIISTCASQDFGVPEARPD
jgi:hypothetical protein